MRRYSFTGPDALNDAELAHAAVVVAGLEEPGEITTGGATGWDTAVCLAALRAWPDAHHRLVLPGAAFNLLGVNQALALARELRIEQFTVINLAPHPSGPARSYRARNERLVDEGDALVGAVRHATFYRSGEWMTVNIARKRDVPVRLVDLSIINGRSPHDR